MEDASELESDKRVEMIMNGREEINIIFKLLPLSVLFAEL